MRQAAQQLLRQGCFVQLAPQCSIDMVLLYAGQLLPMLGPENDALAASLLRYGSRGAAHETSLLDLDSWGLPLQSADQAAPELLRCPSQNPAGRMHSAGMRPRG